ncbi:hypothetical protein INT45_006409 [Circinella minor]|uniref:Uncharacterized protein n=1 Tax=Circinella minor TaxID=1195481 RepID=A0A8H7VPX3_9FUNG|nr:hypothetical protein INT45_006409 [Circinella minor]
MPPPNPLSVHWQHRQDFWAEGLDLPAPSTRSSKLLTPTGPPFPHPSLWHPSSPYYYTKYPTSTLQDHHFQPHQQQSQQPNDDDISVPSNNNSNDKSQHHKYY